MDKTIAQLRRGFVSSYCKTQEFIAFCRTFRFEFKKVLNELGCTGLECIYGHFYISGFFDSADGRTWYFCLDDVRDMVKQELLVRTAQHLKDFRGGINRYAQLNDLVNELRSIIR